MKEDEKDVILEESVYEEELNENEEEEILEEILEDELKEELDTDTNNEEPAPKVKARSKIPSYSSTDELPLPEKDKLTCFIDGYLVTLDALDVKLLNKLTGEERDKYLNDKKARCNEKLIYKVSNNLLKFENNHFVKVDPDELYAAGWHALAKAIKTYDYSKGWLFTTYAYKIIMNEMIQEIKRVKKKVVTKIDGEKVETLAIHISMDSPIRNDNKGNDIYVSDMISDDENIGPEKLMEKDDIKRIIMIALDSLDPTEKFVMTYRYGLDRDIVLTQKEIADKLNQSQANISKIEKTCRLKLRLLLKGSIGDNWEG